MTSYAVILILFAGCLHQVYGSGCSPLCADDETCDLGHCKKISKCDCAENPKKMKFIAFDKVSGDAAADCETSGGCWYARRKRCYEKVVRHPRKDCGEIVPASNRKQGGWSGISINDCFCAGACFDNSIKGTFWCFELKYEKPKIDLDKPCAPGDKCSDYYAQCKDGTCQCDPGYTNVNGECKKGEDPAPAADPVTDPTPAADPVTDPTPAADPVTDPTPAAATGAALHDTCSKDGDCLAKSAVCCGQTCKCPPTTTEFNGECVDGAPLIGPCSDKTKCFDSNAICCNGFCSCPLDHPEVNGKCSC